MAKALGGERRILSADRALAAGRHAQRGGGCWKELPKTLAKKKAIWNNEDFMVRPLPQSQGAYLARSNATSCFPKLAAAADAAGSPPEGLLRPPTDGPMNFRHRGL